MHERTVVMRVSAFAYKVLMLVALQPKRWRLNSSVTPIPLQDTRSRNESAEGLQLRVMLIVKVKVQLAGVRHGDRW